MKNKKTYVTTRTPLRISFFGGGTDIKSFYKSHNGAVITTAIDKYVYVTVKRLQKIYKEKFRLNYSKSERKNKISEIDNKIIKECLKFCKVKYPIYISTISDIPARSGLGSSSSFTVGLLKALYSLEGKQINNKKLASNACKIEIEKLKQPIGKQDQYIASIGGFKKINFFKNGNVNYINYNHNQISKILKNSVIIWTGSFRDASQILKSQNKNKTNIAKLKKILEIANVADSNIKKGTNNNKKFSELMRKNWEIKKSLSKRICNNRTNQLIFEAEKLGAKSYKILGAGGGGFLFINFKNLSSKMLRKFLKKKIFFKIKTSFDGSKVIYKI
tara:strand:- start:11533 stop:12525 length:993 start_codon:yes stop_codon:yes gene_type:complete